MAANGHSDAALDPLEKYRQALRRQSGGLAPSEVAEEPTPPDEPPARDELLELDQPLAAEEPLELDEPLDVEEPLELDEPLAAEEPLNLGEPLEAEDSGGPGEPRTAADWLGLDEEFTGDDPLGLDDPHALEAAPQAAADVAPSGAAADEDVPEELQDTLARYQMAMSKLRSQRAADAPDPLADPGGPAEDPEPERDGDSELLGKYQRAMRRQHEPEDGASEPAPAPDLSRQTRDRLREAPSAGSETQDAEELVRDFPTSARVSRRARKRVRPASGTALGWGTRAIAFAILLVAALPVQWLVYRQLGADFAIADLGAGLSALLPAALILLLARPASGKGRIVMVLGSAAVALIGSAGFAYGLSLLQSQLPQGTSLVFGLLLSLGLFTAVWGPLFLILVPILSRMSLPARSSS